jgi:hypothetical protein
MKQGTRAELAYILRLVLLQALLVGALWLLWGPV